MGELIAIIFVLFICYGMLLWFIDVLKAIGRFFSGSSDEEHHSSRGVARLDEFGMRVIDTKTDTGEPFKSLQIRGLFPVKKVVDADIVTTILDVTDDDTGNFVISLLDSLQEKSTTFYCSKTSLGEISPDTGFVDWVDVAPIVPHLLVPPYGGTRKYKIRVTFLDSEASGEYYFSDYTGDSSDILSSWAIKKEFIHEGAGYIEKSEIREHSRQCALKLGMAVAMADGNLDDAEGKVIQGWIKKIVYSYSEERQDEMKESYNSILKETFTQANNGSLILENIIHELNDIDDDPAKYQAVDLCYQVMAADGVADKRELDLLRKLTSDLNLDSDEIEKIRSSHMLDLSQSISEGDGLEGMLGIDPSWDSTRIRRHLTSEFGRWNGRLNSLKAGEERDKAQAMLENIAKLRQKYNA